jgi:uncharacterized protein
MKIVIDTNVFVNIFFKGSQHHWMWTALEFGHIKLCVTTDILDEYEEIITQLYGDAFLAETILDALLTLPNIVYISKYYTWQLIPNDPDDEKFIDCAIAAGATHIVTNDKHFNVLKKQFGFTRVGIVTDVQFRSVYETHYNIS